MHDPDYSYIYIHILQRGYLLLTLFIYIIAEALLMQQKMMNPTDFSEP